MTRRLLRTSSDSVRSRKAADFDHPCRSRKANRLSPGSAKSAHELPISQRIGRRRYSPDLSGSHLRSGSRWRGQNRLRESRKRIESRILAFRRVRCEPGWRELRGRRLCPQLKVIELRMAILRVFRVCPAKKAASQSFAILMEKFHVSGAPGSFPPSSPVISSMGRSRAWR